MSKSMSLPVDILCPGLAPLYVYCIVPSKSIKSTRTLKWLPAVYNNTLGIYSRGNALCDVVCNTLCNSYSMGGSAACVIYIAYSTRGVVESTIQHEAKPSNLLLCGRILGCDFLTKLIRCKLILNCEYDY